MNDIATALTTSIASDGQTSPTANLPMATFKHTNVGAGTALTDYARLDQAQNSTPQWLSSVAGTDTITAAASPVPSAYAAGQTFRFVSAGANTGAATLNISSLGAKSITKTGSVALSAGDIPSGGVVTVTYDGTRFQLINVASTGENFVHVSGTTQAASAGNSYLLENVGATAVTKPTWASSASFKVIPANGLLTNTVDFGTDTVLGPTGSVTGVITLDLGLPFAVVGTSTLNQWVVL